jgi:transposase
VTEEAGRLVRHSIDSRGQAPGGWRSGAPAPERPWRSKRRSQSELTWLEAQLRPSRETIETLQRGVRGRHLKTRRFCAGLLDEYDALWTFCEVPGISPTNNAAERALRHGVLLRKIQLGTQSQNGNRWIERICTTRETCRLQGRSVLGYFQDVATAAHHRQPIPSLTPT